MAWARSRGSVKVLVMMDRATGASMEPPIAWRARMAMSMSGLIDIEHRADPSPKISSPETKTRRRPARSASAPENMRREARTSR